ncbi:cell division protein FtsQ/DivIB [Myceligenerans pegani]|uniref:Cell division protein FtsQ/DivIB n=1 Tax=Myceligenerans pegani TaxID=2776917 RepID=A0ABR9MYJ2_9MICO|nr:cell division protein FtsQ/DivIB [Myceligenerans sp. TRM 65318]MBE1876453.1 cell division protein FtsQ/DivIB [Myceligenerans sp. TRM 65318]MBE3018724.1 cell division protein FtsQ/DivIB [Myceligenerans sp. TRM 65318]
MRPPSTPARRGQPPAPGAEREERPTRDRTPAQGTPEDRPRPATGPVSMVDRLAERDAERKAMARIRFWRRAAWATGGAAIAVALGWLAFFSPLLALDPGQVAISGEGTTVDVGEVRDEILPERGVPLPRLDTVALRERVLGLNGVKDVRIMRAWPQGLTVELTSREPVVAVPDGEAYALLDEDAVRVGTAASAKDVPVVGVPLSDDAGSRAALFAALDVMAALPPGLAGKVASVTADTQDDVRTRLDDGTAVVWGSGDRLELKARVVTTLRRAEPDARIIDVSSPDLPVTR